MSGRSPPQNRVEQRQAPRTVFGGKSVVQCEVSGNQPIMACLLDVSATGARLLFPTGVFVPKVFKVAINDVQRAAQVVWQKQSLVGVRFTDDLREGR